eukprot:6212008-Pleurochrysis_carterae.AAC.1
MGVAEERREIEESELRRRGKKRSRAFGRRRGAERLGEAKRTKRMKSEKGFDEERRESVGEGERERERERERESETNRERERERERMRASAHVPSARSKSGLRRVSVFFPSDVYPEAYLRAETILSTLQ